MDKKQNKLSAFFINPQNFTIRYWRHAVCMLMMADTRHCNALVYRLNT